MRAKCAKCGGERETKHYYCRACKAAKARAWRKKNGELSASRIVRAFKQKPELLLEVVRKMGYGGATASPKGESDESSASEAA